MGVIRKIKAVVKNEEYIVYLKANNFFIPLILRYIYIYIIYTCISVYTRSVWKNPAIINVMRMVCATSM